MNVAVIGGHKCSQKHYLIALELGKLIAQEGWILICGGRTGVMEAACQGAHQVGGITVGIMPTEDGRDANPFVKVRIPTGLGYARNFLVVRAADIVVAVDGECGTLSELAFALSEEKTVLGIDTWDIPGVVAVKSAREAADRIKRRLSARPKKSSGRQQKRCMSQK